MPSESSRKRNARYCVVFITAPNEKEAWLLSEALVEEKLAACASMAPVRSIYTWKNKTERSEEVLLICKTKTSLLDKLIKRVKKLHSYEVPEIIALPIIDGSEDYLEWVEESMG